MIANGYLSLHSLDDRVVSNERVLQHRLPDRGPRPNDRVAHFSAFEHRLNQIWGAEAGWCNETQLFLTDDATEKCTAAPNPPMDILTTDVYADGGWAWRN